MLVGKLYSDNNGDRMSLLRDGSIVRATRTVEGWDVEATQGNVWEPYGIYKSQGEALMALYIIMTTWLT